MSAQFDEFKKIFEEYYPEYKSWVEENSANFPPDKIGTGAFTTQEASMLLLDFYEIISVVLENEEQCLKCVSGGELYSIQAGLSSTLNATVNFDYIDFVNRVEGMIPHMRSFQFLFMEKIDEKRYREISDMDKTLSDIRKIQIFVTSAAKTVESDSENLRNSIEAMNKKNEELDRLIGENNQKTNNLTDMHEQTNKYLNQINDILNSANSQKSKIDGFVNLIQEREEKITSQNVATETYEEKLKEFSEKHDLNMAEARKLIEEAHEALNLSTAIGLGKAFYTRQQKLERWWIKLAWLAMGISAVSIAVSIGYTFLEKDLNIEAVVGRSLLMTVLVAVAAFFSRQYSRNRVLEEDYAYKVALVASYPGIATEFKDADARKEYVVKLLDEILQDPQRVRHDKELLEEGYPLAMKLKKLFKKNETKTDELP